ncbi:MAG: hypothetical protein MJD61_14755 [Proteobacteria bacterium]|nr:hypothetical protein [Pseudomonadota bacterium]
MRADDEKATSPGDVLRELFKEYGPCLVLIDARSVLSDFVPHTPSTEHRPVPGTRAADSGCATHGPI